MDEEVVAAAGVRVEMVEVETVVVARVEGETVAAARAEEGGDGGVERVNVCAAQRQCLLKSATSGNGLAEVVVHHPALSHHRRHCKGQRGRREGRGSISTSR